MYIHIFRGLIVGSFSSHKIVFITGVIIILLTMGAAFFGYVLPWGNISYWGATVISSFLRVIPFIGRDVVVWFWGRFSVSGSTLTRFFLFHFILPLIIVIFTLFHFIYLHAICSSNPLGTVNKKDIVRFYPYYFLKDLFLIVIIMLLFNILIIEFPFIFIDASNFEIANPISTPTHIKPEWYFLFSYAILRSIPNKIGGVVSMLVRIVFLFFFVLINLNYKISYLNSMIKLNLRIFSSLWVILSFLGASSTDYPFNILILFFSLFYFCTIFFHFLFLFIIDSLL